MNAENIESTAQRIWKANSKRDFALASQLERQLSKEYRNAVMDRVRKIAAEVREANRMA